MIEDKLKTGNGAREVEKPVWDGEEVLGPDISSSVHTTILGAINVYFKCDCHDKAARLLNAHQICQSKADQVPGIKYSI